MPHSDARQRFSTFDSAHCLTPAPTVQAVSVDVAKSSLVGLLLENGEDDLAAVLAVSELPDVLDIERDRDAMCAMGIPVDELASQPVFAGVTKGRANRGDTDRARQMEATVSRRWADLVDTWTGR